jgi:hypothetical protein
MSATTPDDGALAVEDVNAGARARPNDRSPVVREKIASRSHAFA